MPPCSFFSSHSFLALDSIIIRIQVHATTNRGNIWMNSFLHENHSVVCIFLLFEYFFCCGCRKRKVWFLFSGSIIQNDVMSLFKINDLKGVIMKPKSGIWTVRWNTIIFDFFTGLAFDRFTSYGKSRFAKWNSHFRLLLFHYSYNLQFFWLTFDLMIVENVSGRILSTVDIQNNYANKLEFGNA